MKSLNILNAQCNLKNVFRLLVPANYNPHLILIDWQTFWPNNRCCVWDNRNTLKPAFQYHNDFLHYHMQEYLKQYISLLCDQVKFQDF
jgi:hypothetical protein